MPHEEVLTPELAADYRELSGWLAVLHRRRAVLATVTGVVLLAGLSMPVLTGYKYEAVATVSLRIPSENVQTTTDRVKDHDLLTALIADLRLPTSAEQLSRRISVAEVRDSIQISVRGSELDEVLTIVKRLVEHLLASHLGPLATAKQPFLDQREQLRVLIEEEDRHMELLNTVLARMNRERRNDPAFMPILQGSILRHATDLSALHGQIEFVDERLRGFGSDVIGYVVEPISPWPVAVHTALAAFVLGLLVAVPAAFLAEASARGGHAER